MDSGTPFDSVNLNINVCIFTPDERPLLLKWHFSGAKGMASQEGFHCMILDFIMLSKIYNVNMLKDCR